MDKRTVFTQLPSAKEVEEILCIEGKRRVPKGKETIHYVDFELVIRWLDLIGVESSKFLTEINWKKVMDWGVKIQDEVVRKTLEKSEGNGELGEVLTKITEYIGEVDDVDKAEVAFVFGSKDIRRARMAAELWTRGKVNTILLTGGRPSYAVSDERAEAEVFLDEVLRLGVPRESVIVENKAITVADSVKTGLESEGMTRNRILIIIAWFAMRRAWSTMMKLSEAGTEIVRMCPEPQTPELTRENWYKNEVGIRTIFNEWAKMRMSVLINTS